MSAKRITAFVGSARKGHTYQATVQFLNNLQAMGDIEYEIVRLSEYKIGVCRGCRLCFDRGEEHCPHKDDRDVLIEKMMASDGVIFATPNYSFQVSALLKLFLDRLGYVYHRPQFFGRTFTGIVTQGIYGGNKIVDYLNFAGYGLGFKTVKGSCVLTIEPITEKQQRKIDRTLAAHAARYWAQLQQPAYAAPSLLDLAMFRFARTKMRLELDDRSRDYQYYAEKGWFEADFYYPAPMGVLMKGLGRLLDSISASLTKARYGQSPMGGARAE